MQHITLSAGNLRDHHTTSTNDHVEIADGKLLPITGYGRVHLEADRDTGDFTGTTKDLDLQRVAHVRQLGNHNLLSVTELDEFLHTPLQLYPIASAIRPPQGPKLLTLRKLESDLLEIQGRRRPPTSKPNKASSPNFDQALLPETPASKPHVQDIIFFTSTDPSRRRCF